MKKLWESDKTIGQERGLIGVDEAGRGCLAGPVVAAAVYLPPSFFRIPWEDLQLPPINDSKKMSPSSREKAFHLFCQLQTDGAIGFENGFADVKEIDQLNILGATRRAMERAMDELVDRNQIPESPIIETQRELFQTEATKATHYSPPVLIDGRPLKPFSYHHQAWIGGDGRSLAIAMASIVAKVTRDLWMDQAARKYPHYRWEQNKGYGTKEHRIQIQKLGSTPLHRRLFLRKIKG